MLGGWGGVHIRRRALQLPTHWVDEATSPTSPSFGHLAALELRDHYEGTVAAGSSGQSYHAAEFSVCALNALSETLTVTFLC